MENQPHEFQDTKKLVDWILTLESNYPVETWKINDVYVWPLIRNSLYISLFYAFNPAGGANTRNKPKFYRIIKFLNYFKSILSFISFYFTPLSHSDTLFSGANSHRDFFKGKWLNKFFDPLISNDPNLSNSYIVEYAETENENISFRPNFVINLPRFKYAVLLIKKIFEQKKSNIHLKGFENFLSELKAKDIPLNAYTKKAILKKYYTVEAYSFLFDLIIKKTKAKKVIGLCYYSAQMYGMNLAAWRNNIYSIDVQHGGQGSLHLAYAQFTKLPPSHLYNLLPKQFWCWDKFSADEIEKWIIKLNSTHEVYVGGHPWLNFLKDESKEKISAELPIVLYTLQPYGPLIDEYIIKTIINLRGKVKWILRLHPRQADEAVLLNTLIESHQINDCILKTTHEYKTLPEMLVLASIHLTKSSGTVIEASILGIPNIVLDSLGQALFISWINSGKAVACIDEDYISLSCLITKVIKNAQETY